MMNRVVLVGRLTKDPELRYTPNGVAVATFTLSCESYILRISKVNGKQILLIVLFGVNQQKM